VLGAGFQPFACRSAQALDHVLDILHRFGERRHRILVGAEPGDLGELLQGDLLGRLHLPGAFVQRLLAAGGQQARSLAGNSRALRRQLQAGREAGNIPSAEFGDRSAEMSQHQAGPSADDDRHAGDDGEGRKQAAPDAEFWKAEALESKFADAEP
jgi:hypothetical protein